MHISPPVAFRALTPDDVAALSDDELLTEQTAAAGVMRQAAANGAVLSAEIARRSHPDFGYTGLAQSLGARKPEMLVAQLTGLSAQDARRLDRVGTMVAEPSPWLTPVSKAVSEGDLSLAAADVIRAGLGDPGRVAADDLLDAAISLVAEAPSLTFEQLAARARDARTQLDLDGVPAREEELRGQRWLAFTPLPNGNVGVRGELDPESAAIVQGAVDAITSPRRGGPRFRDEESPATPEPEDNRTLAQMAVDALVDLVKLATLTDTSKVVGKRRIALRMHVSQSDFSTGEGFAWIEGQTAVVSVATAQRLACDTGLIPVMFDKTGQVVNLGRQQRLYPSWMKAAIAARDGGCRVAGCDRPPEMCEVHHVLEWMRDNGETSIENGILLCRYHHMLLHNNGWRIERDGAEYTLINPAGQRFAMPPKNPIRARL